jgi:hypothetical protein
MAEPITTTIEISQQQMGDFGRLLSDVATLTGRELPSIVGQASVWFLQSAAKETKLSKTKRPVETNPDRVKLGRRLTGPKYRFQTYTQGRSWWNYTDDRMDPKRVIQRRGAARNTWKAMIPLTFKGNASFVGNKSAQSSARSAVDVRKSTSAENAWTEMRNSLSYMAVIAPHVMASAMGKTHRRMEAYYLKALAKKQEAKWRT